MQQVFYDIEKYQMISAKEKVIVGVSGGADSLCLLFILREYQEKMPFELMAVHVEHGIRGNESIEDAAFVEELCKKEQIAYRCFSVDVPKLAAQKKLSVEEAARLARYEIFEQVKQEWNADKIAVAHNQNDQAETMLFRMARGTGLDGACGIRPVNGNIIRPLLGCSRAQIESYLKQKHRSWREDRTNQEICYARNSIRHQVLPILEEMINEKSVQHLAQFGTELQKISEYFQAMAKKWLESYGKIQDRKMGIPVSFFKKEEEIQQEYIIREALKKAGCPMKDMGRTHIASILAMAEGQSGRKIFLPGRWCAERNFDWIWFFDAEVKKEQEKQKGAISGICETLSIPGRAETPLGTFAFRIFPYEKQNILQKRYTKWLDYDKISSDIQLRTRLSGDYLVVTEQGGTKKLKKYFIEEKIPAEKREQIPLFAAGNEILWVVGYRISERCKVGPNTKYILEIQRIGERYGREN